MLQTRGRRCLPLVSTRSRRPAAEGAPLHWCAVADERIRLEVQERAQLGSAASRRLRRQGFVPGILKDYQQDALRGRVSHIDLQEVRLDQPIQAQVTIELVGEPAGVKEGGVL